MGRNDFKGWIGKAMTALYRAFDVNETLLYVGVSANPFSRIRTHKSQSRWWKKAVKITLDHFRTKESARRAESLAIKAESPKYNLRSRPGERRNRIKRIPGEMNQFQIANKITAHSNFNV